MNDFGLITDPVQVRSMPGYFLLESTTCIVHDDEFQDLAMKLKDVLLDAVGIHVPVVRESANNENVILSQGQLWTEYMPNSEQVEYMAFPRTVALSEVLWSPRTKEEFIGIVDRIAPHLRRLEHLGVSYRVP